MRHFPGRPTREWPKKHCFFDGWHFFSGKWFDWLTLSRHYFLKIFFPIFHLVYMAFHWLIFPPMGVFPSVWAYFSTVPSCTVCTPWIPITLAVQQRIIKRCYWEWCCVWIYTSTSRVPFLLYSSTFTSTVDPLYTASVGVSLPELDQPWVIVRWCFFLAPL